jgi:hypothetical protein
MADAMGRGDGALGAHEEAAIAARTKAAPVLKFISFVSCDSARSTLKDHGWKFNLMQANDNRYAPVPRAADKTASVANRHQ